MERYGGYSYFVDRKQTWGIIRTRSWDLESKSARFQIHTYLATSVERPWHNCVSFDNMRELYQI